MEYIYGALLLHKLEQPVNEENLKKVILATGVTVDESKVKALVASLEGVDIGAELKNASVAVSSTAVGAEKAEDKEEKKEEKKEESAAGLASLFG
ncbi:50S ribosomal protein P1 [Candidatus Parvarchaeota archaeon]|nr:MAG: 50S ribosomal protein P1 [Candidatus Parvarchaeota archaeon]